MTMTASAAVSGTPMAIGDAAVTAVLGYAVVFFGLALLMYVIILFGKIMAVKAKAPAPAEQAPARVPVSSPVAPGSAGELKLYDVSDRDAAMIMAIVANQMGKPLNELRFLSIREVK